MKKYIVFTFALILLALLITACGKKTNPDVNASDIESSFQEVTISSSGTDEPSEESIYMPWVDYSDENPILRLNKL